MSYHFLHLDIRPPRAELTLDRPPLNVISVTMMRELQAALGEVAARDDLKALVVRARGRAFCVGTDIAEHLPEQVEPLLVEFRQVILQLLRLPCPSVAVVQGDALGGGCELVSACDLVVAAEGARFGQPEMKLAVFPPIANVLLPRLIGPRRAYELILGGEPIEARQACAWGLVNRVVLADQLEVEAERLIASLCEKSGPALRLGRRALADLTVEQLAAELEAMERRYQHELVPLPDYAEGLQAFLEKRAPRWEGES